MRFGGEVVNADSRLFYRGMDVGTAKPSPRERQGIDHHLVDTLDPQDEYSLNGFLSAARRAISDIDGRGKLPIVVGGSGQYAWGLLEGWQVPEIPPDPRLRQELEAQLAETGIEALQRRLKGTGATNIERVEVLNPRRLVRSIERAIATGDAMGGASKSEFPPYDALVVGLKAPRDVLHQRVALRVEHMVRSGWLDEVRALLRTGVKRDTPSMSAIGYRPLIDHIEGNKGWQETSEEILIGNHRLIGAQHNWFKPSDNRINWFDITAEGFVGAIVDRVARWRVVDPSDSDAG